MSVRLGIGKIPVADWKFCGGKRPQIEHGFAPEWKKIAARSSCGFDELRAKSNRARAPHVPVSKPRSKPSSGKAGFVQRALHDAREVRAPPSARERLAALAWEATANRGASARKSMATATSCRAASPVVNSVFTSWIEPAT